MKKTGNKLRIYTLYLIFNAVCLFSAAQNTIASSSDSINLATGLQSLSEVISVEGLQNNAFPVKFLINIKQPIDYKNPETGSFSQRVVIGHAGFDKPTVLVTEGYGGRYALSPSYMDELARLFETNLVVVEHRYFLESTPEPTLWEHLTVENAMNDLHRITSMLKTIYKGKWISTGISKGGQTSIYYKAYFPDDIDIVVPYVAPMCKGVEDGRHEPFLRKVATAEERKAIQAFQTEILKRRESLTPLFEEYCREKGYTFKIPLPEVYDLSVLEYPFAFWQWGTSIKTIPDIDDDDRKLFLHWMNISDPDYFRKDGPFDSFFVQAARELGYYGYDTKPLKKYLSVRNVKGYLPRVFLTENNHFEFDNTAYKKVTKYIRKNDPKMILIYGEFDPWSAAAVSIPKNKNNMMAVYEPGGSHKARISTLPDDMAERVKATISRWLTEN